MMSSYRPEEVLEEAEIWNQRESTGPAAGTGVGKNMGWFLTLTSGHIPTTGIVVGHGNIAGGQGRPPRADDIAGTAEEAQTLTMADAGARFGDT